MTMVESPLTATRRDRIRTPRLICERLRPQHTAELSTHLADPRVSRWMWPEREPPTEAEVLEMLATKMAHWERHGFGLWLLRDRASGEMVGRGGLQHTFVAGRHEIEVGWSIVPERWGQGLATELALASVTVGFDDLRLRSLIAFTMPHNMPSRRVMEKAGFAFERGVDYAGFAHVLYRRGPDAIAGES
jgi:ribosomal-protein-alanine N-acetyltransferase